MPTKRTLHLHVGLPKCGSSSLQRFLLQHAGALREAGFHYPRLVDKGIGNLTPYAMTFKAEKEQIVFRYNNPDFDAIVAREQLIEVLNQREARNMILSSEALNSQMIKTKELDFILEGFDETVIHIFFRGRAPWLMSHYTQAVKTGKYRFDFTEFLESSPFKTRVSAVLRFADHIEQWFKKVGSRNVNIHFLAKDRPSPIAQFLYAIGLNFPAKWLEVPPSNSSPSPFQTCILASINRGSQQDFLRMSHIARNVAAKFDPFPGRTLMTQDHVDKIQMMFRDDTEYFLKLQNAISRDDLESEVPIGRESVSFEEIRDSVAFKEVEIRLAERGIQFG